MTRQSRASSIIRSNDCLQHIKRSIMDNVGWNPYRATYYRRFSSRLSALLEKQARFQSFNEI